MRNAIEIKKLSLPLDGKIILNELNFSVTQGRYLTIFGENGSGKSSILKCILSFYENWTGAISVNNESVKKLSRLDLAKIVSYMPQRPPSDLEMDVDDFLKLARYPYHRACNFSADREAINQAVEAMEIQPFLTRKFSSLSGGEQQRVMLASVLVQNTPIILLDEPGASLDPAHRFILLNRLKKISKERFSTVIEVSHDLNTAFLLSDDFLAIKNGKLLAADNIGKLFDAKLLSEIYKGSWHIFTDEKTQRKIALTV